MVKSLKRAVAGSIDTLIQRLALARLERAATRIAVTLQGPAEVLTWLSAEGASNEILAVLRLHEMGPIELDPEPASISLRGADDGRVAGRVKLPGSDAAERLSRLYCLISREVWRRALSSRMLGNVWVRVSVGKSGWVKVRVGPTQSSVRGHEVLSLARPAKLIR